MKTFREYLKESTNTDSEYFDAIKNYDSEKVLNLVKTAANNKGYRIPAFHGTRRADRVGNKFLKTRATSGPMAFFTSDMDVARSYSVGKQDTSLQMPENYRDWFLYKLTKNRSVNIRDAWHYLTTQQKLLATQRLYTTGYENSDTYEGNITCDTQSIMGKDSIDWELKSAKGNALEAAKNIWLDSSQLFNNERIFIHIMKCMGVEVTLNDPHQIMPKVYEVYLKIENPLITDKLEKPLLDALVKASHRQRTPKETYGVDPWEKTHRYSANEWMQTLMSDIEANRNSFVWTSIPDWVTQVLKHHHYDGIKDSGGKQGGEEHAVWVPFEPYQIKSAELIARDTSGKIIPLSKRFDSLKTDIRY